TRIRLIFVNELVVIVLDAALLQGGVPAVELKTQTAPVIVGVVVEDSGNRVIVAAADEGRHAVPAASVARIHEVWNDVSAGQQVEVEAGHAAPGVELVLAGVHSPRQTRIGEGGE